MRRTRKKSSIKKPMLIIGLLIALLCIGTLLGIFHKNLDNLTKPNKNSAGTNAEPTDKNNQKDSSNSESTNTTDTSNSNSIKDNSSAESKNTSNAASNTKAGATTAPAKDDNENINTSSKTSNSDDKHSLNAPNTITPDNAKQIVTSKISKSSAPLQVNYDHSQQRDGKTFYVFQVSAKTPDSNLRDTVGWYYVDQANGDVYNWDLINDTLSPVK